MELAHAALSCHCYFQSLPHATMKAQAVKRDVGDFGGKVDVLESVAEGDVRHRQAPLKTDLSGKTGHVLRSCLPLAKPDLESKSGRVLVLNHFLGAAKGDQCPSALHCRCVWSLQGLPLEGSAHPSFTATVFGPCEA